MVHSENEELPSQKAKLSNIDCLKTPAENTPYMGHLTEKYGIQETQPKLQKGATNSLVKKGNAKKMRKRRYLVRAIAHSPIFSATLWAYACSKLASAERLFERKRADGEFDVLELLDRQDLDERTGEYRVLRSSTVRSLPEIGARHSW